MFSAVDRYVIARERNVVTVDFSREPDPPAPRFPGANGLRLRGSAHEGADTQGPALSARSWSVKHKIRANALNSAPT